MKLIADSTGTRYNGPFTVSFDRPETHREIRDWLRDTDKNFLQNIHNIKLPARGGIRSSAGRVQETPAGRGRMELNGSTKPESALTEHGKR